MLLARAKEERTRAEAALEAAAKAEARTEALASVVGIAGTILSQRAIALMQALILPLIAVSGGLDLWSHMLRSPTTPQLIAVALYGALVLAPVLLWANRSK